MKMSTIALLIAATAATVLVASAVGPLALPEGARELGRQQPTTPAIVCNTPVVEAFEEIRVRALEISDLAAAVPAPLEDTAAADRLGGNALAALGQRIAELHALIALSSQPAVNLTPHEQLLAEGVRVHAARLANLSARVQAAPEDGEFDAAYVVGGLDAIAVQGWELAQLISDAALCEPSVTISESTLPHLASNSACEAFEPEYELAMHGSCSY